MPPVRPLLEVVVTVLVLVLPTLCCTITATREEQEPQHCPVRSSSTSQGTLAAYGEPSATSLGRVAELLDPLSLQTFVDNFWEKKPLILRGRSPDHAQRLLTFGLADVEAVIANGVSLSGAETYLVSASDWNIIKRVFNPRDGEFWTAAFSPPPSVAPLASSTTTANVNRQENGNNGKITLDQVRGAFQRGGFSVVINYLQRRWRGVANVALALEDVLGHPVNANMYMTPPGSQGFEAHFDWMDGLIVQVAGSKKWILYDELVTAPRPDLKYKPSAADLGEPLAVIDLHPGDFLYIPRGYPHEAAVNGTGKSGGPPGVSLHVTFGVESTLSGSYESLLHHALEVAAVDHPEVFFGPRRRRAEEAEEEEESEGGGRFSSFPWLQLLHLCVHDVASREQRLRKAVPLAPLFQSPATPTTPPSPSGESSAAHPEACALLDSEETTGDRPQEQQHGEEEQQRPQQRQQRRRRIHVSTAIALEFQRSLQALDASADASSTLHLLDSLLLTDNLERVPHMFSTGTRRDTSPEKTETGRAAAGSAPSKISSSSSSSSSGGGGGGGGGGNESTGMTREWTREVFEGLNRSLVLSSLTAKLKGFLEVASLEASLETMLSAGTKQRRERAVATEKDLARSGQT